MCTVSIITINYNNKVGFEKTIKSVVSQTYNDFEHVIIDGNSIDGSKVIIEKYKDNFSYSISELDTGIYNAMNKGIRVSKGKYLLFLNSGDVLENKEVLSNVSKEFISDYDIYYGNLILKNNAKEIVVTYPKELSVSHFYSGTLPHSSSFIKRDLFDTVFYYNEKFSIVSDWEFFICAICKYNVSYKYFDEVVSIFYADGISNMDKNIELIQKEREEVIKYHFPLFKRDVEELIEFRKNQKINRVKMIVELEKSSISQKLNSLWLSVLLKFFRNKTIKDLP